MFLIFLFVIALFFQLFVIPSKLYRITLNRNYKKLLVLQLVNFYIIYWTYLVHGSLNYPNIFNFILPINFVGLLTIFIVLSLTILGCLLSMILCWIKFFLNWKYDRENP